MVDRASTPPVHVALPARRTAGAPAPQRTSAEVLFGDPVEAAVRAGFEALYGTRFHFRREEAPAPRNASPDSWEVAPHSGGASARRMPC